MLLKKRLYERSTNSAAFCAIPFHATQISNSVLNSMISVIHDKG
jgi:hypothetical protein